MKNFLPSLPDIVRTLVCSSVFLIILWILKRIFKNFKPGRWIIIQYSIMNKTYSNNLYKEAAKLDFYRPSRINVTYTLGIILCGIFAFAFFLAYYSGYNHQSLNDSIYTLLHHAPYKGSHQTTYSLYLQMVDLDKQLIQTDHQGFIYIGVLLIAFFFLMFKYYRINYINYLSIIFLQRINQIRIFLKNDDYNELMYFWSNMNSKEDYDKIQELLNKTYEKY